MNSLRHRVHWAASKFNKLSLGKVQSQKLPILTLSISLICSLESAYCCISIFFSFVNSVHVGDCWKYYKYIVENGSSISFPSEREIDDKVSQIEMGLFDFGLGSFLQQLLAVVRNQLPNCCMVGL